MTATAFTGPLIVAREDVLNSMANPPVGIPGGQNPDSGPSLFHMAIALLDPRPQYTYDIGQSQNPQGFNASGVAITGAPTLGWLNAQFQVADYAPGTASTSSIAPTGTTAALTPPTNAPVTLTTSAGSGVTPGSTCTNALTGQTVTGLWLIDNVPGAVTFGTGTYGVWDPANPPIARCVNITSAANLSANTFTITGYDAYGYPITQVMAGPNATTTYSTKAFKWLSGVTIGTTATTTFSIGVSDIYGLPMFCSAIGYLDAYWNNAFVTGTTVAATTFTAGSTSTFTTSSDVRGTINLGGMTTSNGARKLQMWQSVAPANLTVGALFGVTPA